MADGSRPSPDQQSIPKDLANKETRIPQLPSTRPEQQSAEPALRINTGVQLNREYPTTGLIEREISQSSGQIPYSKFIELSLFGPEGYYMKGKVNIGNLLETRVDFKTSPEVSEFFGATIGMGLARTWEAMGKPPKFDIVEMGAGRGSLAHGLLKWIKELRPDFYKALQYTIVEQGKDLIGVQRNRNGAFADKMRWVQGSAYQLPLRNIEGAIISNELPDAFPIERVKRVDGKVKQLYVSIENNQWVEVWGDPAQEVNQYIADYSPKIEEGIEEPINLNAVKFQKEVDRALERGIVLTVDYGANGQIGKVGKSPMRFFGKNTRGAPLHVSPDPLIAYKTPGEVDITADVNFNVLEQIAQQDKLKVVFSGYQRDLLRKLGLHTVTNEAARKLLTISKSWYELTSTFSSLRPLAQASLIGPRGMGLFYSHILSKNLDMSPAQIFERAPALAIVKDGEMKELSLEDANLSEDDRRKLWELYFSSISPQIKGLPVNIGIASGQIAVIEPMDRIVGRLILPPSDYQPTTEQGIAYLDPNILETKGIYDAEGNLILDLRKKEDFARLVTGSGYAL